MSKLTKEELQAKGYVSYEMMTDIIDRVNELECQCATLQKRITSNENLIDELGVRPEVF